jgi:hypothetical protein
MIIAKICIINTLLIHISINRSIIHYIKNRKIKELLINHC